MTRSLSVSEGLNSVETSLNTSYHNSPFAFQKDLIVWKHDGVWFCNTTLFIVSEGLNSVETQKKADSSHSSDSSFRRT